MLCPKCGKENPDNIQVCQHCSSVLKPNKDEIKINAIIRECTIVALVFSILSFFTDGIFSIPAIIFGIIAIVIIFKRQRRSKWLWLAISAIIISIITLQFLFIVPGRPVTIAHRVICGTYLKSLGKVMYLYANDHNGNFPTPSEWCDLLKKNYNVPDANFICPSNKKGRCSYAMNPNATDVNCPNEMVLLFETTDGWNQFGGPEILTLENHQGDGMNVLFVDGHDEFVIPADVNSLRWTWDK